MNWEVIGVISAFIASVATLLTLFYLAMQLRESNKLARSSSLQAVLEGFSERFCNSDRETFEVFNKAFRDYQSLGPFEKQIFQADMSKQLLHFQNVMQLHHHGLIDDVDYAAWATYVCSFICTTGGTEWWKLNKLRFSPTVMAAIDKHISDNPNIVSMEKLEAYRWEKK